MEIYLSPWILLPLPSWIIFLSTLFEGLSETANKGERFDQHVCNEKSKHCFINEIVDIALSATQIPLSIFTKVNALQKESLILLEGFCIFGYREFYKNLLCILMVVNKTIYGNNGDVPDILLNMFLLSSPGIRNHMNLQEGAPDPVFPQSYEPSLTSRNSSSTIVWPNGFNIPCPHCLQSQPFMTNLELDGI